MLDKIVTDESKATASSLVNQEGCMVESKGIYICEYEIKELKQKYNLYAAPKDVCPSRGLGFPYTHIKRFKDNVVENNNLLGYSSASYDDRKSLFDDLKSGDYEGQWFTPTLSMLEQVSTRVDKSDLNGSFNKTCGYLWLDCGAQPFIRAGLFDINNSKVTKGGYGESRMRPVRLEPIV
tara:strand:- start:488754 stop:489290 length:537 start_codon:yes stop_codon:yes gene_type:complete